MAEKQVDFIGSFEGRTPSQARQFASRGIDDAFRPERFIYDPEADTYTCPQGKVLRHKKEQKRAGKIRSVYTARIGDCRVCSFREKCGGKRRSIVRSVNDPAVSAFIEKMKTGKAKDIYTTRAPIAEFPHAWIKQKIGLRQFHVRGLLKVGMEALWAWASGAGEPPPCALSEPGVSLSTHRAPIIQPSVAHQTANAETAKAASWLFLPARKPLW
jgi:hypothetical protein